MSLMPLGLQTLGLEFFLIVHIYEFLKKRGQILVKWDYMSEEGSYFSSYMITIRL